MLCDANGTPLRFLLSDGQASDISYAQPLLDDGVRSINSTYPALGERVTVASLANSSTAAALRNPLPTAHVVAAQVRGAATYRAPGR